MYVIPRKLVFCAHPHMASQSVAKMLQNAGAGLRMTHHQFCPYTAKKNGGIIVCVKRNMFDLIVCYFALNNAQMLPSADGFRKRWESWLPRQKFDNNWLNRPLAHYGLPHADRVLRFEHLGADLLDLWNELELKKVDYQHVGATKREKDYRKYYSPGDRAFVEETWAEDLRLTGYEY